MNISSKVLYTFLGIAILVPLILIIGIGIDNQVESKVYQEEILKASLNLLLLGVIGMLGKELLLAHTKQKLTEEQNAQREIQKEIDLRTHRIEALNKLTEGYWGIKKALHLIFAHKSAKSYKEQMHLIIDHRLKLQQLNNEIQGGLYEFAGAEEIAKELDAFDNQINELVNEWTKAHLALSWQQTIDEKEPPEKKAVPLMLNELENLNRVWGNIMVIHAPFQKAANQMRDALK
jgi:hypothetical protein